MRKRAVCVLVWSGLSLVALTGTGACGADPSQQSHDEPVATARPLDAYLPTAEADRVTAVARDLLARECLSRYGLGQDRPVLPVDGGLVTRLRERAQAAEMSVERARRHGFHPPPEKRPQPGTDGAMTEDAARRWADRAAVLNGWRTQESNGGPVLKSRNGVAVPEEGCVGEADERLSDGIDRPVGGTSPGAELDAVNAVLALRKEAADAAAEDPAMIDVARRWSDCFEAATGTEAPTPFAVANDPRWASGSAPTEEEIDAAVALTTCRAEVGYRHTTLPLIRQCENEVIGRNQDELERLRQFFTERFHRAREVVEASRE